MLACADSGPLLPPLGDWQVQVGKTWHKVVRVNGGAAGRWRWTVVRGPVGLQLAATANSADLWWTADAFSLAPTKPTQARAAGVRQVVEIEAVDSQGDRATTLGSLQAVPTL
ncbi:MAG: hypothetical protein EXR77_16855 [Myxococcales bacterium]|nr:hypothetical protein [Myxococcales bacterium]